MMGFVERALPRTERRDHHATVDEQVSWRLADERLERREEARKRARKMRGRDEL